MLQSFKITKLIKIHKKGHHLAAFFMIQFRQLYLFQMLKWDVLPITCNECTYPQVP